MSKLKKDDIPPGWVRENGKLIQREIVTYPGLILGKDPYSNNFIAAYGQTYLKLAAPPSSGKDVGVVTPNMLQYPHSIVCNDIKFETYNDTAGFRHACGQKVYRFSPGLLETHHWNPYRYINKDALYRLGELRGMGASLYTPDNEKNASWFKNAAEIFVALSLFLIESDEYPLSLPQVNEIVSLGTQLGAWVQQQIDEHRAKGKPLSDETVRELNSVISATKSKEYATLLSFLKGPLTVYGEKTVALAVTDSDNPVENIDFSRLREEPTTIYFCVTEPELTKFAGLMNLFYSQAIRINGKVLPKHGGNLEDGSLRLKYQVLYMMNEFAIMGRMEVMETAAALTRGNGLRYAIFFQNESQVCSSTCYGPEGGKALLGTFHNTIVFAPGDIKVATEYSERLGKTTVRVPSDSTSVSDGGRSKGRSWSYQPRPLMLPQEVDELPYDEELIFMAATNKTEGLKIRARKIKWYEEPIFKERVDPAKYPLPPVPVGDASKINGLTKSVIAPSQTVKLSTPQGDDIRRENARRVRPDVPELTEGEGSN